VSEPASSPTTETGRSRAGNAMARTRAAVLAGARACVQRDGTRKTTMVDVAATAGVAKATLYNHFRTKGEVRAALVDSEVAAALRDATEAAGVTGLPSALVRLAERVGEHPVVRRLATSEPGVLADLVVPASPPQASWGAARAGLATLLADAVPPAELPLAVETLLRWLVSQLLWPTDRSEAGWAVARLLAVSAATAPPAPAPLSAPAPQPPPAPPPAPALPPDAGGPVEPAADTATVPGLGFPGESTRVGAGLLVGPAAG